MSLKDDVEYVKHELGSDEKLLESAFKLERIYKKYKIAIWGVVILAIVGFGGKSAYGAYERNKLEKANEALTTLRKNPKDSEALAVLKSHNPRLYELFVYSKAVENSDSGKLKELTSSKDARIADIASYHDAVLQSKSGDSIYYRDLSAVEKAYIALKAGKKDEARNSLALVSEDSPVAGIARLLKHYTITADGTKEEKK
jgi:hypothetical protein